MYIQRKIKRSVRYLTMSSHNYIQIVLSRTKRTKISKKVVRNFRFSDVFPLSFGQLFSYFNMVLTQKYMFLNHAQLIPIQEVSNNYILSRYVHSQVFRSIR